MDRSAGKRFPRKTSFKHGASSKETIIIKEWIIGDDQSLECILCGNERARMRSGAERMTVWRESARLEGERMTVW